MDHFRLFLHVLSASVWVGGQIVLAGLLPTVRTLGPDAPKRVARAFNRIAWPAFGVAVVTGIWNVLAVDLDSINHPAFEIKFTLVVLSGVGAAVHIVGRSRAALAVGGALSSVCAVAAMYVGFLVG